MATFCGDDRRDRFHSDGLLATRRALGVKRHWLKLRLSAWLVFDFLVGVVFGFGVHSHPTACTRLPTFCGLPPKGYGWYTIGISYMVLLGGFALLGNMLLYGRLTGTGEIAPDARVVLKFAICQTLFGGLALSLLLWFGWCAHHTSCRTLEAAVTSPIPVSAGFLIPQQQIAIIFLRIPLNQLEFAFLLLPRAVMRSAASVLHAACRPIPSLFPFVVCFLAITVSYRRIGRPVALPVLQHPLTVVGLL